MSTFNAGGAETPKIERNPRAGNGLHSPRCDQRTPDVEPPAGDACQPADLVVEIEYPMASVVLIRADTDAGREWLRDHVAPDALTLAGRVACERRYLPNLVDGARGAGLVVEADR